MVFFLKPLLHPCRDGPQAIVHLSRRFSENQANDRLTRNASILETAQNVNLRVGEHDTRARGVLDGVFGFAVFACDTADGAGEMVALEGLDIFNFEGCT